MVYGDRGVGKTSLAKTTCKLLLHEILKGGLFVEKRCDSQDSFASIVQAALIEAKVDISTREKTLTHNEGGDAQLSVGIAKASLSSKSEHKTTANHLTNTNSPSWVAEKLKDCKGIFLIDEVDAIPSLEDKKKIAELIKLLSDFDSEFKLVVVGIATTGSELTAGHPSVERCLKEVQLKRMSDDGIKKIILNGMKQIDLIIGDEIADKIVDISAGFPHFTHLVCLKCAEIALVKKIRHINFEILKQALVESVKDSEGVLKHAYDSTIRLLSKPQDYKILLLAAAYCKIPEFRSSELKDKLVESYSINIDSQVISRRLASLVKIKNGSAIISRSARGCFRFIDPRMPSFIKMSSGVEDI
ncbi:MAG: AAA family ATPase [Methylococcaceae bacterium]|nr:AAA family ATPase [Methylococcaceae bacterium]MDP3904711.1 AAA family ATPase [Methylococcaceae bacterium]